MVMTDEYVYNIHGRASSPQHGLVEATMSVTLSDAGPGLTRLEVNKERSARAGSSTRSDADDISLTKYPFFFRRDMSTGEIVEVLHAPGETDDDLLKKRTLAASHQRVIGDAPTHGVSNWDATEDDVDGHAQARYSVRPVLGRLRQRILVQKRLNFAMEQGFELEVNTTTELHETTGVPLAIRQRSFWSFDQDALTRLGTSPSGMQFPSDVDESGPQVRLEGFDFLPDEPSMVVWTLERSLSSTAARRKLHELAQHGLIAAPLRHIARTTHAEELNRLKVRWDRPLLQTHDTRRTAYGQKPLV